MGKGVNFSGTFVRKDSAVQQLPEKPLALGANYFRELSRRIETIVPTEVEKDALILVKKPNGSSPGLVIDGERIVLTVCRDGEPARLEVVGRFIT